MLDGHVLSNAVYQNVHPVHTIQNRSEKEARLTTSPLVFYYTGFVRINALDVKRSIPRFFEMDCHSIIRDI